MFIVINFHFVSLIDDIQSVSLPLFIAKYKQHLLSVYLRLSPSFCFPLLVEVFVGVLVVLECFLEDVFLPGVPADGAAALCALS